MSNHVFCGDKSVSQLCSQKGVTELFQTCVNIMESQRLDVVPHQDENGEPSKMDAAEQASQIDVMP